HHGVVPALQMREIVQVLPLRLMGPGPADRRHVGDGIFTRQELPIGQLLVHDAIETVALVRVALDRVFDLFLRVIAEMVRLPGHRAKAADLPEQPFLDPNPRPLVRRIELAELAPEILKNGAGFEHRDRLAARTFRIDNGGHAVVGSNFQELRLELVALADIHIMNVIGNAQFLQHDRDLEAVWRRPVMQFDGCVLYSHGELLIAWEDVSTKSGTLPIPDWTRIPAFAISTLFTMYTTDTIVVQR